MKKILVTALVATMLTISLIGCGGDPYADVSPKAIVQQLETEYVRMPMPVDEAMAQEMYHINLDDVEEYAITKTGMSPGVGFAMVVKAKDGKVDAVKEAVDKVLADQVNAAFYPDEKEIAEAAEVKVDGNIVSLLIFHSEVSADVEKVYQEALDK